MRKILQFITDGTTSTEIISQIKDAVSGGCRWVQIRMKHFSDKEIENVVESVLQFCRENGVCCIMNDRVDIAAKYQLDGVHLGREDMCVAEARQILGDKAIIGMTANTIEDILLLSQQPINYFGIGPMRFTVTKKNLSPSIGLSGYKEIISFMNDTGICTPAVAIGGITCDDVHELLDIGLWGVAVSSAIAHAGNPKIATSRFLLEINKFNK